MRTAGAWRPLPRWLWWSASASPGTESTNRRRAPARISPHWQRPPPANRWPPSSRIPTSTCGWRPPTPWPWLPRSNTMDKTRLFLVACLLLLSGGVLAADQDKRDAATAPLPAWEQLSAEQRALLVAPLRERWNANPAERARMYHHAERWHEMTPEQRKHARRGMRHWEHMSPERRSEMKA